MIIKYCRLFRMYPEEAALMPAPTLSTFRASGKNGWNENIPNAVSKLSSQECIRHYD